MESEVVYTGGISIISLRHDGEDFSRVDDTEDGVMWYPQDMSGVHGFDIDDDILIDSLEKLYIEFRKKEYEAMFINEFKNSSFARSILEDAVNLGSSLSGGTDSKKELDKFIDKKIREHRL